MQSVTVGIGCTAASEGLAGDGGIVDARVIEARRAQIDHDGRWTIKRGRTRQTAPGDSQKRQVDIAVPVYGYTNHVGIDREFGFLRSYTSPMPRLMTAASSARCWDRDNTASDVWADTAYHSAANLNLLDRRGLKAQFQRKKPRGKKNATAHRPRQCQPRSGAIAHRARLRCPKVPARAPRAHRRRGARPRQNRSGQSRL